MLSHVRAAVLYSSKDIERVREEERKRGSEGGREIQRARARRVCVRACVRESEEIGEREK